MSSETALAIVLRDVYSISLLQVVTIRFRVPSDILKIPHSFQILDWLARKRSSPEQFLDQTKN